MQLNQLSEMESLHQEIRQCTFCHEIIPHSNFQDHFNAHMANYGLSNERCQLCDDSISYKDVEDFMVHITVAHNSNAQCCFCKLTFNDFDELFYHLKASLKETIHCSDEDCEFSTSSHESIEQHCTSNGHNLKHIYKRRFFKCLSEPLKKIDKFKLIIPNIPIGNFETALMQIKSRKRKIHVINSNFKDDQLRFITGNKKNIIKNMGISNPTNTSYETLDYSKEEFDKLFDNESQDNKNLLLKKMAVYKKHKVLISEYGVVRTFSCSLCNFKHRQNFGDIRRHVMGVHCKIPKKFIENILKTSTKTKSQTYLSVISSTHSPDEGAVSPIQTNSTLDESDMPPSLKYTDEFQHKIKPDTSTETKLKLRKLISNKISLKYSGKNLSSNMQCEKRDQQ